MPRNLFAEEPKRKPRNLFTKVENPNEMGQAMAGVTGFNTGVERITHGVLQPLLESGYLGERLAEGSRRVAKNRESEYARAHEQHPWTTGISEGAGQIGATLPAFGGATSLIGSIAPRLSPYAANVLAGIIGGGGTGAAQYVNPNESRLENLGMGAGIGGAVNAIVPGAGKLIKYGYKQAKNHFFPSEPHVAKDLLEGLLPSEVNKTLKAKEAGNRIGLKLSPAEASGNPILAKKEGKLGTSKEGEMKLYEHREGQRTLQKKAIDNLLNDIAPTSKNASRDVRDTAKNIISKKESALAKEAKPFYEASEKVTIKPNQFNQLTKDSNIVHSLTRVKSDPLYASELGKSKINSIKTLDLVKRDIDDKIESAVRAGEKNKARILRDSKQKLVETLDKISPEYKKARSIYSEGSKPLNEVRESALGQISKLKNKDLKTIGKRVFDPNQTDKQMFNTVRDEISKENPDVWNQILRNEMERRLDTKLLGQTAKHGSNFYKTIVSNDKEYNLFNQALKNNPKAQHRLADMRLAFKDLVNNHTVKTAAGQAKSSLDVPRSSFEFATTLVKNLTGGKYDKAAIEIISNDTWHKQFENIMKEPAKTRDIKLLNLFNKIAITNLTSTRGED